VLLLLVSKPACIGFFVMFAVGNKDDDADSKVVLSEDAKKFAAQSGITLFETSAKENVNVEEVCSPSSQFCLCSYKYTAVYSSLDIKDFMTKAKAKDISIFSMPWPRFF